MAVKSAQTALDNYVAAMGSAQTQKNYRDGINATTVNPMALAATDQALSDYQNACVASVQSGKRARALLAVNPAVWKQNAVTVGAANLASGAQKAKAKLAAVYQQLQQVWQQQAALKQTIPGSDAASGRQRMNEAFDLMVAFGQNRA